MGSITPALLRNAELNSACGPFAGQIFVRSLSVVSRRLAGETLIVPVRGKVGDLASIYSFNETGSLIWDLLESSRGATELIDAVAHAYAVGHDQAEQDVLHFLADMLAVGLVEARPQVSMAAAESNQSAEMSAS